MKTVKILIAAILLLTILQTHGQDPFSRKILKGTTRVETPALKPITGDSVSLTNSRLTNAKDPINPQDLVNLRTAEDLVASAGFAVQTGETTIEHGLLYNWYAGTDSRGLTAAGWRIPTKADFDALISYLGGFADAGGKLKETGTTFWNTPNTGATNESGYNGYGSGARLNNGTFTSLKSSGYYLCSSENSYLGNPLLLSYDSDEAGYISDMVPTELYKRIGMAARPVKITTTLTNGQSGTYTGNDGRVYQTICIGTQEWLSENLAETKYRNGDVIPEVTGNSAWTALTSGALCAYNNDWGNVYETTTATAVIANGDTLSVVVDSTMTATVENGELHLSANLDGTGTDDQTAAEVTNEPFGGVAATSVQSAINELDNEKANLSGGTFTGDIAAPKVGVGTSFAPQEDGTILYHTAKWFTPTGTVSSSGTTVTSAGTQFTSAMVGAKLTISGEQRIITAYNSTSSVTVATAYSQNYSGVVAGSWGVYNKSVMINLVGEIELYGAYSGTKKGYIDNLSILRQTDGYVDNHRVATILNFGNATTIKYSTNTDPNSGTKDLGLRRNAAGVLEIYDGVTSGAYRDITLRNVIFDNKVFTNKIDTKTGVDGNISFMGNGISGLAPATTDSMAVRKKEFDEGLALKVNTVSGKDLSTEDYSSAEKSKLAGIAEGAEVNVNADWDATSGDAQILNKPSRTNIGDIINVTAGEMVKAESDSTLKTALRGVDYISGNKSQLRTIRRLGGSIVTWGLRSDMGWPSTHTLVDNTIIGVVLEPVEKDSTITGVFYTLNTAGIFTGVDTCSIAVGELGADGVTLTKVAEVTPSASIFKATANTKVQMAFTTTYTMKANKLYYLYWLYNNSAEGTAPKFYAASNNGGNINKFLTGGVTKIGFNIPGSNSIPSTITLTDAQATYSVTPAIWIY